MEQYIAAIREVLYITKTIRAKEENSYVKGSLRKEDIERKRKRTTTTTTTTTATTKKKQYLKI